MFKKGPIPALVHGLVDYLFGAFLIASPFLFSFDSGCGHGDRHRGRRAWCWSSPRRHDVDAPG